ncbi:T9SS type A sorting domain-containing protein [Aequorivita marisscotiae]
MVFDIYGNVVLQTFTNKINTSRFKPGIYIIKTQINNETITKKIIK